ILLKINAEYPKWIEKKKNDYIHSDKENFFRSRGITCAIEFRKDYWSETESENLVFVHIRGELEPQSTDRVKCWRRIERGFVGEGGYGIVRKSILLRSN